MVATLLSELAGKGLGRYAFPSSNETKEVETSLPTSPLSKGPASSSTSSLQKAAQSAYSGISNVYSSLYVPSLTLPGRSNNVNGNSISSEEDGLSDSSASISGLSKSSINSKRRRKSVLSPNLFTLMNNPYIGVRGGGRLHRAKPPHESMDAVRKLLYVVEDNGKNNSNKTKVGVAHEPSGHTPQRRPSSHSVHFDNNEDINGHPSVAIPFQPSSPSRTSIETNKTVSDGITATPIHRNSAMDNNKNTDSNTITKQREELLMRPFLPHQLATIDSMSRQSLTSVEHQDKQACVLEQESTKAQSTAVNSNNSGKAASSSSHSPEETASQLTEGTLRAMRDLALDEALELHKSLKYWSDRWERPVFSWFIAGPLVWFGFIGNTIHYNLVKHNAHRQTSGFGKGYDHAEMIGQRVSQIQAVLTRRLSAIGELQHHLLRAGWQRGVAHWGFLGEGGNWAAVDGTDGRMQDDDGDSSHHTFDEESYHDEEGEEDFHDEEVYDEKYQQPEDSEHFFVESEDLNATNAANAAIGSKNAADIKPLDLHHYQNSHTNHRKRLLRRDFSENEFGLHIDLPPPPLPSPSLASPRKATSLRMSQHDERRNQGSLYYANLHVRKRNGGYIQKDDQALAEWSIDALALIRSQLIRAANGKVSMPFSENWPFEHATGNSSVVAAEESSLMHDSNNNQNGMPAWAGMKYVSSDSSSGNNNRTRMGTESRGSCFSITEHEDINGNTNRSAINTSDTNFPKIGADCFESHSGEEDAKGQYQQFPTKKRSSPSSQRSITSTKERVIVGISNLPLMMNEISSLLDIMEDIMDIQRARRLERLKPPPWWRQNWFLVVLGPPSLGYLLYNNLIGKGQTWNLVRYAAVKMMDFAREHVVTPCVALYDEFTKGPESISDHAARDTATETLKKMIRSWLDETYPEMHEVEKVRLSDAMDITLIEESKESSMKSVYNMNSVIRMSFIEAQFIKKEMMNALVALDEMQASTNFNMNLAAITPFVLLMWTIKKASKFIFYTMFKWGKSRMETYRSFLDALTEIERLLIMRSNPPAPPIILRYDANQAPRNQSLHATPAFGNCVLESDDLGMLMLHIHELRMILWQERRRFSPNALRSVAEDLAELSGERGAVSVRQQLLIVERMNRAYSFLKQGAID